MKRGPLGQQGEEEGDDVIEDLGIVMEIEE